ncbi:HNH endonuclease, partial [Streptomyces sp. NPDC050423]|uniref:HNH endonuclease n=1 Tax=Streptomyces sp. NPDC050423 TaxID=3155402 RepID=UPI00343889F1
PAPDQRPDPPTREPHPTPSPKRALPRLPHSQCAFCGYDGRIGAVPVGLEAAHVRWWAFDGPDDVENGLCLCSLHHKLFDKGVLGLGEGRRILVSQSFVGHSTAAREHVITLAGRPLIGPRPGVRPIAAAHRSWHTSQVFHGSPRPATTA